jgi:hypothetical protein
LHRKKIFNRKVRKDFAKFAKKTFSFLDFLWGLAAFAKVLFGFAAVLCGRSLRPLREFSAALARVLCGLSLRQFSAAFASSLRALRQFFATFALTLFSQRLFPNRNSDGIFMASCTESPLCFSRCATRHERSSVRQSRYTASSAPDFWNLLTKPASHMNFNSLE